jgi:hypothetical protein
MMFLAYITRYYRDVILCSSKGGANADGGCTEKCGQKFRSTVGVFRIEFFHWFFPRNIHSEASFIREILFHAPPQFSWKIKNGLLHYYTVAGILLGNLKAPQDDYLD